MFLSIVLYCGLISTAAALILFIIPARWRPVSRPRALVFGSTGFLAALVAVLIPASESRVDRQQTALDVFMPVWQFNEVHSLEVAAPPARVYEAISSVRADEIWLFSTLTWIRRGGRSVPQGILSPGSSEPILDVALRTGFVRLAEDRPRELVLGTVIVAPRGTRGTLTPELFKMSLPPGFVLATMNFLVSPNDRGGSTVSTETRVFVNSPSTLRLFAVYWRLIYPGSAIIRSSWLSAIARRAGPQGSQGSGN
jgi:hypothetical protein